MFFTYILYSKTIDRYYIGHTDNIDQRLAKHLEGTTRFTARAKDWQVVFTREFSDRNQAIDYEKYLKSMKSKKYLAQLVESR